MKKLTRVFLLSDWGQPKDIAFSFRGKLYFEKRHKFYQTVTNIVWRWTSDLLATDSAVFVVLEVRHLGA